MDSVAVEKAESFVCHGMPVASVGLPRHRFRDFNTDRVCSGLKNSVKGSARSVSDLEDYFSGPWVECSNHCIVDCCCLPNPDLSDQSAEWARRMCGLS